MTGYRAAFFLLAALIGCAAPTAPTQTPRGWSPPQRVGDEVFVAPAAFREGARLALAREGRAAFAVWKVYLREQGAFEVQASEWTPAQG